MDEPHPRNLPEHYKQYKNAKSKKKAREQQRYLKKVERNDEMSNTAGQRNKIVSQCLHGGNVRQDVADNSLQCECVLTDSRSQTKMKSNVDKNYQGSACGSREKDEGYIYLPPSVKQPSDSKENQSLYLDTRDDVLEEHYIFRLKKVRMYYCICY